MNNILFQAAQLEPGDRWDVALFDGADWLPIQSFVGPSSERAATETVDRLNSVLDAARTTYAASLPEDRV